MRIAYLLCVGLIVTAISNAAFADEKESKKVPPVLNFKMKGLDGKEVDLSKYQGRVVLFVNVASYCGYTRQYKGLQALYEKHSQDGLVIIGVPANEFGQQEPGSDKEIAEFCDSKYGVKFQLLSKVVVNGDGICPLYKFLTSKNTNPNFAGPIGWNFEKFLIGRNGEVVGRYESKVEPDDADFVKAIERELKK
jgi:glutathione peroxidase